MYGGGKVGLVGMLFAATTDDHASGDALGKVVHGKSGENLLENVLHFFGMEGGKANRVLEVAEGGFNTPAHGIKLFEFIGWIVKVRDNGFVRILRNLESNNTKRKFVEQHRVSFAAGGREEIEGTGVWYELVMITVFIEHFCFVGLLV